MILEGKVALVTGAGQGIGAGIARRLHQAGATVVIAEYDETSGSGTAASLERGGFVQTDVRDRDSVVAAVQYAQREFGGLDVLVNNAYPTGAPPRAWRVARTTISTARLPVGSKAPCGP